MSSVVFSLLVFLPCILFSGANNKINPRIIGGEVSANGQFPYAVGFYYVKDGTTSFCGGSLLNSRYILTAAHCVVNATEFNILLGTNNLETPSNGLNISSTEYVAHPSYNPSNLANDIGLILLDAPIDFTANIQPIEVSNQTLGRSESVIALGWGATSDVGSSPSNTLYHVPLTTISNLECSTSLSGAYIDPGMVCVIGVGNQGTCRGDAGGPLVQIDSNGINLQVGVSIFHAGLSCESTTYPSGFIRTGDYIDWINNITELPPSTPGSGSTVKILLPLSIFVSLVLLI